MKILLDLQPISWKPVFLLPAEGDNSILENIHIDKIPIYDGPARYAVRREGAVLDKVKLKFVYEPLPSNRTKQFFAQCRFDRLDTAQEALINWIQKTYCNTEL